MAASEELPTDYDAIILGTVSRLPPFWCEITCTAAAYALGRTSNLAPKWWKTGHYKSGMSECIIAAALARVGHKVLHMDRNDFYSGDWATFHFQQMQSWIKAHTGGDSASAACTTVDVTSLLEDGEKSVELNVAATSCNNLQTQIYISEKPAEAPTPTTPPPSPQVLASELLQSESGSDVAEVVDPEASSETNNDEPATTEGTKCEVEETVVDDTVEEKKQWTMQDICEKWRKFNIDLSPKVLLCRGPMVELLISSDIAKYCEFRAITRVLTEMKGKLEQVPCSRSDVFSSKQVSVIEKRMLMKFLSFAMDYDNHKAEYEGFEGKSFVDFLKSKKLTPTVQHYVQNAIAMATDQTSTLEGLKSTQRFLQSLGRYGNTAFLWPLYGSGELPQCFCRMCAVFGGIYCLRRTAQHMVVDSNNRCTGVIDTEGKKLKCKWLVMEASYAGTELLSQPLQQSQMSRMILLTDRSILPDKHDHITLLHLPPGDCCGKPVTLMELSTQSMACPPDIYVVHLTCEGGDAVSDLQATVDKLFIPADSQQATEGDRPHVLWSVAFNMCDSTKLTACASTTPDNVHILSGPSTDLDCDLAIAQARSLFAQLCPDEEFIPRAPNPEDIIFDDPENAATKDSGFGPESADGSEGVEDSEKQGKEGVEGKADQNNEGEDEGSADGKGDVEGKEMEGKGERQVEDDLQNVADDKDIGEPIADS